MQCYKNKELQYNLKQSLGYLFPLSYFYLFHKIAHSRSFIFVYVLIPQRFPTISNMSFETTSNLKSCVIAQYEGYSESKQEEVDIAL